MERTLWIVQLVVALLFTLTGALKVVVERDRLAPHMRWAASWPAWRVKLLGLAELAGAAGLVLPRLAGVAPLLTPLAAACLALLMAGAVHTHRRLGEGFGPALVAGVSCVAIAVGRLLVTAT